LVGETPANRLSGDYLDECCLPLPDEESESFGTGTNPDSIGKDGEGRYGNGHIRPAVYESTEPCTGCQVVRTRTGLLLGLAIV
jgi:hypothetical protein